MARIKGDIPFSGNFELQKSAPLDAFFCNTLADMLDPVQQQAHDGIAYMYYYKRAIVFNDPTPENNGEYRLVDVGAPTIAASWVKLSVGSDIASVKRIEVDSISSIVYNAGFAVDDVTKTGAKYFPNLIFYFNLFLFEFEQEGIAMTHKDKIFSDLTGLNNFISTAGFVDGISLIIRCYYYEDSSTQAASILKGRNHAFSILKAPAGYFGSNRSFGVEYAGNKWPSKGLFVNTLMNDFFAIDSSANPESYANVIWFPGNQRKYYSHHRDNVSPPVSFPHGISATLSNSRGVVSDAGVVDLVVNNIGVYELVSSKFYNFDFDYPSNFQLLDISNLDYYSMISDNKSVIRVYHFRHKDSSVNYLLVKPVGVDKFYVNGVSNKSIVNLVGVSKSYAHRNVYRQIGYSKNTWGEDVSFVIPKDELLTLQNKTIKRKYDNINKVHISVMFNYGNGVFSKKTNNATIMANSSGVSGFVIV